MDPTQEIVDALKARDGAKAREVLARHPGIANAPTPHGLSLLTMAIYARAPPVIDALLDAGAQPTLHEAAAMGDLGRVRALAGADPALVRALSPDGMTPLHLAAHFGQEETLAELLTRGADPCGRGGPPLANTPLHAAIAGRQHACALRLLEAGADPNAMDGQGNTPMAIAAANGLEPTIRVLVAAGGHPIDGTRKR